MTDACHYQVIIGPAAEADLNAITDYLIAQGADQAARQLLVKLFDRITALETFPARGSVPKELEGAGTRGFRQFVSGPYRVVYQVGTDRVTVVVVADGRRDMHRLLHERLLGDTASGGDRQAD